jgi:hypothetical protein
MMDEPIVTLRQVFSIPADDDRDSSADQWNTFQESLAKELKEIKCPVPMSELVPKICELFDLEVPSLLLSWWKKAEDLKSIIEESRKEPDAVRYLDLAEHTIDSEHHPYLEVKIKNATLKRLEFSVHLLFSLKGFALKISDGRIREMTTGMCEVEGTVGYGEITILRRGLAPIHLPGVIPLERSLPTEADMTTDKVQS